MDRHPTIISLHELSRWGIKILTGESDPYGMRLLCDLTEQGAQILTEYFSVKSLDLFSNWNRDAVASILLPREIFSPLVRWIMFHVEKVECVIVTNDGTIMGTDTETANKYAEYEIEGIQIYRNWNKTPGTNRNEHVMSGRAE